MKYDGQVGGRSDGSVASSAVGTRAVRSTDPGWMRGAVLTVFAVDKPFEIEAEINTVSEASQDNPQAIPVLEPLFVVHTGTYCSVMLISKNIRGLHVVLPYVLIADAGGLHDGDVEIPRGSSRLIDGRPLPTDLRRVSPDLLDGDHVYVGFQDTDPQQPVVMAKAPHPGRDRGTEGRPRRGRRPLNTTVTDGRMKFSKFLGVVAGVDANGNRFVDSTRAHTGELSPFGHEPVPEEEMTEKDIPLPTIPGCGDQRHFLRGGQIFEINFTNKPGGDGPDGVQNTVGTIHTRVTVTNAGLQVAFTEAGDKSVYSGRFFVGTVATIPTLKLELKDSAGAGTEGSLEITRPTPGNAVVKMNGGLLGLTIGPKLQVLYGQLVQALAAMAAAYNAHTHETGDGLPTVPYVAGFPTWTPDIISTVFLTNL